MIGGTAPPAVDDSTSDVRPSGVTEWRTEYWGAVAVDVPADWGYGGAPVESGRDVVACYPEAMVGPDGNRLRQSGGRGWVGRPIAVTDVCALYPWIEHSPELESTTPYVWLGAAVEPGVVDYGDGFVEETVEVEGVTVTVASDDAALRQEILGSARPGDLCAPRLDGIPEPQLDSDGDQDGSALTTCSYRRTEGGFALSYGAFGQTATPYDDTVDASKLVMYRCTFERDDEFVLLTTDRGTYVVDFTCPRLLSPDGRSHSLKRRHPHALGAQRDPGGRLRPDWRQGRDDRLVHRRTRVTYRQV